MDMRAGQHSLGSPEMGLLCSAALQLGRRYGLPSSVGVGASDSKSVDGQASYEKAMNTTMCVLAGAKDIVEYGVIEAHNTASMEQVLIDHEICGLVSRYLKGIEVSDETLALPLIKEVGTGGNFLGKKHTRDHFLTEHHMPTITDRRSRVAWEKKGSKNLREKAKEKIYEILKEYQPPELERDIKEELEKQVKKIRKRDLK